MTFETFAKGIAIFTASFSELKVDDKKIAIWFGLLNDLPDKAFLDGITALCRDGNNFFPGTNIVSTIRRAANEQRRAKQPQKQLDEGFTDEQFEEGRKKIQLIIGDLTKKWGNC